MAINQEMTLQTWQKSVRVCFADKDVIFSNSETNIMAFMMTNISTNILIGRYEKHSHTGRIFDNCYPQSNDKHS